MELTTEAADSLLSPEIQECPQSSIHGLTFGLEAGNAERLTHQFIVDYDVCPHRCVCPDSIIHINGRFDPRSTGSK